jgi:hypothetical protein
MPQNLRYFEFLVVFAGIGDGRIVIEWSKSGYVNFFEFVGDEIKLRVL